MVREWSVISMLCEWKLTTTGLLLGAFFFLAARLRIQRPTPTTAISIATPATAPPMIGPSCIGSSSLFNEGESGGEGVAMTPLRVETAAASSTATPKKSAVADAEASADDSVSAMCVAVETDGLTISASIRTLAARIETLTCCVGTPRYAANLEAKSFRLLSYSSTVPIAVNVSLTTYIAFCPKPKGDTGGNIAREGRLGALMIGGHAGGLCACGGVEKGNGHDGGG